MDGVDRQVQVVVPKGAPPKSPGQKEDERRQEARRVCRAKWHEVLNEVLGGLPVLCRDGGWNGKIWNVLWERWRCDDVLVVPEALVGVCESGVAENGSDDCDGRPVGSVMLQVCRCPRCRREWTERLLGERRRSWCRVSGERVVRDVRWSR